MNRLLLLLGVILLILSTRPCFATDDSTKIVTPEGIGKYLSKMLINRADIRKSPLAINISKLFPNEDFSKYKDSPANLILNMLYGQQILLPQVWDKLLHQADSLNIDKEAKYLKTYFNQTLKDQFLLAAVLTESSKYYIFTFNILEWKNDRYVTRVYENIKEYKNMKDLEENLFDIEEPDTDANEDSFTKNDSLTVKEYKYNQSYKLPELDAVFIPSASAFVEELTNTITQLKESDIENILLTADEMNEYSSYKEYMNKIWNELILNLKGKKDLQIKNKSALLCNFPNDLYNVIITYNVDYESKKYTFSCVATLVNNQWKLTDIFPLSLKSAIKKKIKKQSVENKKSTTLCSLKNFT